MDQYFALKESNQSQNIWKNKSLIASYTRFHKTGYSKQKDSQIEVKSNVSQKLKLAQQKTLEIKKSHIESKECVSITKNQLSNSSKTLSLVRNVYRHKKVFTPSQSSQASTILDLSISCYHFEGIPQTTQNNEIKHTIREQNIEEDSQKQSINNSQNQSLLMFNNGMPVANKSQSITSNKYSIKIEQQIGISNDQFIVKQIFDIQSRNSGESDSTQRNPIIFLKSPKNSTLKYNDLLQECKLKQIRLQRLLMNVLQQNQACHVIFPQNSILLSVSEIFFGDQDQVLFQLVHGINKEKSHDFTQNPIIKIENLNFTKKQLLSFDNDLHDQNKDGLKSKNFEKIFIIDQSFIRNVSQQIDNSHIDKDLCLDCQKLKFLNGLRQFKRILTRQSAVKRNQFHSETYLLIDPKNAFHYFLTFDDKAFGLKKYYTINYSKLEQSIIKTIFSCEQSYLDGLVEIDLSCNKLTNKCFEQLIQSISKLKDLRLLNLSFNQISSIKQLQLIRLKYQTYRIDDRVKPLRKIDLSLNPLSKQSVSDIIKFSYQSNRNLNHIEIQFNLQNYEFFQLNAEEFFHKENLQNIQISGNANFGFYQITNKHWNMFSLYFRFSRELRQIDFSYNQISQITYTQIQTIAQVRGPSSDILKINLENNFLKLKDIQALKAHCQRHAIQLIC